MKIKFTLVLVLISAMDRTRSKLSRVDDYFKIHQDIEITGYEVLRQDENYIYYRVSEFTKNIFKDYTQVVYITHLEIM